MKKINLSKISKLCLILSFNIIFTKMAFNFNNNVNNEIKASVSQNENINENLNKESTFNNLNNKSIMTLSNDEDEINFKLENRTTMKNQLSSYASKYDKKYPPDKLYSDFNDLYRNQIFQNIEPININPEDFEDENFQDKINQYYENYNEILKENRDILATENKKNELSKKIYNTYNNKNTIFTNNIEKEIEKESNTSMAYLNDLNQKFNDYAQYINPQKMIPALYQKNEHLRSIFLNNHNEHVARLEIEHLNKSIPELKRELEKLKRECETKLSFNTKTQSALKSAIQQDINTLNEKIKDIQNNAEKIKKEVQNNFNTISSLIRNSHYIETTTKIERLQQAIRNKLNFIGNLIYFSDPITKAETDFLKLKDNFGNLKKLFSSESKSPLRGEAVEMKENYKDLILKAERLVFNYHLYEDIKPKIFSQYYNNKENLKKLLTKAASINNGYQTFYKNAEQTYNNNKKTHNDNINETEIYNEFDKLYFSNLLLPAAQNNPEQQYDPSLLQPTLKNLIEDNTNVKTYLAELNEEDNEKPKIFPRTLKITDKILEELENLNRDINESQPNSSRYSGINSLNNSNMNDEKNENYNYNENLNFFKIPQKPNQKQIFLNKNLNFTNIPKLELSEIKTKENKILNKNKNVKIENYIQKKQEDDE